VYFNGAERVALRERADGSLVDRRGAPLALHGEASWPAEGYDPHEGGFDATGVPRGGVLQDNSNCGGMNVRFQGPFARRR
jgi:hypothetical protein